MSRTYVRTHEHSETDGMGHVWFLCTVLLLFALTLPEGKNNIFNCLNKKNVLFFFSNRHLLYFFPIILAT